VTLAALVVLGGLASSLLVTLLVLPVAWLVTAPRRAPPEARSLEPEAPRAGRTARRP
jgi:hypothetical protein